MIKFKTLLTEGIDPFYNRAMGIMSAERGNLSPAENESRSNQLEHELKARGHDVTPVMGGYVENHGTPQAKHVHERSFLVQHHSEGDDNGAVKKSLIELGQKYDQDSVLHKPHNTNVASLHGTNNAEFPGKGKSVEVGSHKPYSGGEFYTQMPDKKRFTFEGVNYSVPEIRLSEISANAMAAINRMKDDPRTPEHMRNMAHKVAGGGEIAKGWSAKPPAKTTSNDGEWDMDDFDGALSHHKHIAEPGTNHTYYNAKKTSGVKLHRGTSGTVTRWTHMYHDHEGKVQKDMGFFADTLHDSLKKVPKG